MKASKFTKAAILPTNGRGRAYAYDFDADGSCARLHDYNGHCLSRLRRTSDRKQVTGDVPPARGSNPFE
jgi:hypothetical protein